METGMNRENDDSLIALAYSDLGGITRARVTFNKEIPRLLSTGVNWTAGNQVITPLDGLAPENPYGSQGDFRLIPDLSTEVDLRDMEDSGDPHFVICDAVTFDMEPWAACPRGQLKAAVADFEAETSLRVVSAFEHEFTLLGIDTPPPSVISLAGVRELRPLIEKTMEALRRANLEPQVWYPEFGPHQHECTVAPAEGIKGADRAVMFREVLREVFNHNGVGLTFSPVLDPEGIGNGMHVHLSLRDDEGNPVLADPAQRGGLSTVGARFAAGIVRHAPALTAFTAPSAISGGRMFPGRWSASHPTLSVQDREAALRICPTIGRTEQERAASFNIEYRASDATASPYLVLTALIRAGLEGIKQEYELPEFIDDPAAAEARGELDPLPRSIAESLDALEADPVVSGWFTDEFLTPYTVMKRYEHEQAEALDEKERHARYSEIY